MKRTYGKKRDRDFMPVRSRSRHARPVQARIRRGRGRRRAYTKRKRSVWKRFLPFLALLVLLIFSMIRLAGYLSSSLRVRKTAAELQELHEIQESSALGTQNISETPAPLPTPAATAAPSPAPTLTPEPQILSAYQHIGETIAPDMRALYEKNDDLAGWIKIPGGVVNAPVVYRDHTYYLDHDFYGRESLAGALFLDKNHPLAENTQNLLIYGHNMHDGTMFGHLGQYRKASYWKKNCMMQLSTLYAQETYVIFAVIQTPTDPSLPGYVNFAGHPRFRTVREFEAYMEEVQTHSLHPWRVDVNASDALATLVTCLDDERIVLLARRLRENESAETLASRIAGY